MGAKPLLSICMIFKNEIHCLERCLRSLSLLRETISCELVMADTGATDGSREIAAQYADILIDFPWVNDFAAARNAVLDHCTGEWFLTIDCDEWVEDIAPLIKFLRSDKARKSSAALIAQRNYMDLDERENFQDAWVPRLANRKNGQMRYTGAIHETPVWSENEDIDVVNIVIPFFLHHDGYAMQQEQAMKSRTARNMKLLQEELQKTPENLRCLIECVQSEPDIEKRMQYAERIVDVVRNLPLDSQNPRRVSAFHEAIAAAYRSKRSEQVRQWCNEALERFPDSMLLRIDANGYLAMEEYQLEHWKETIEYCVKWKSALEQYNTGKGFDRLETTMYGMVQLNNIAWRTYFFFIMLEAACKEEYWEQAQEAVDNLAKLPFTKNGLANTIHILLKYADHLNVSDCIKRHWNLLLENKDLDDKEHLLLCKKILEAMSFYVLLGTEHRDQTLQALINMGACDPARCARALLSDDPETVRLELSRIENWNHTLDAVVTHAVTLSIPLPEGFFTQRNDDFAVLATKVKDWAKDKTAQTVLQYVAVEPYEDSLVKLLWLDNLTSVALFAADWANEEEGVALCKLFIQLEGDILTNLYRYEVIEEEDLLALPAVHRFGWRLCKGMESLSENNGTAFIQQLKAGVKDVPEMKKAVAFLSEHIDQLRPVVVTPEMQELAAQIQAVLAQYEPDDPAVAALKESPAYQQVAYLLESPLVVAEEVSVSESSEEMSQKETIVSSGASRIRSAATLDRDFSALLEECGAMPIDKLVYRMKRQFQKLPEQTRTQYENYLNTYPLWGSFRTKMNDYKVFEEKARSLIEHAADYAWLYDRLEDFRSRKLLYAILHNWCAFDFQTLDTCIERCFDDYFDLDVMPCMKDEVVVDLGAYIGDTALSFARTYGANAYKHYYCYEISAGTMEQCKRNTASLRNLLYCQKGAGAEKGVMYLQTSGGDASAHSLSSVGQRSVEVVALDEDIAEPITFLKMDIEGAEQAAIRGAAKHITNDRPKMALSVYHNNEDLWKIPRMIDELCPDCRFYLRYHGGNAWPTEITFFAVPN